MKNAILSAAILAVLSGSAAADTDIDLFSTSYAGTEVGGIAVAGNVGPGLGVQFVGSSAEAHNVGHAWVNGFGIAGPNGGFGFVNSGANNLSWGDAGVVTIGNGIGVGYGEYGAGGLSIGTIDISIEGHGHDDYNPPSDDDDGGDDDDYNPPSDDDDDDNGNGRCNNGVGNGPDCLPPGSPPNNDDDEGDEPGNPGNQGGFGGNPND